ncbi:hypothetical protein HYV72_01345 [Candidatus Uhrbacteria bacterium]|nr:hypothetical protein [Candidatus Uhrbacteria bacterium]
MPRHSLEAIVTKIDDSNITLRLGEQTLLWPKERLSNVSVNDHMLLVAFPESESADENAEIAKALLNELLTGDSYDANQTS